MLTAASVPTPAANWPTGHRQHTGQVDNSDVTYAIDWQDNGELSGTYYYNQSPGAIHRLTGAANAAGELRLLEVTRGKQSARCVLQRQNDGYVGTMSNSDGRQMPMSLN